MHPIGFSTGALAKSEFDLGLQLQRDYSQIRAVELSALREHELQPLVEAAESLELSHFNHISVHAPSKLRKMPEKRAFELLSRFPEEWPLIVHPGIMQTPSLWRELGPRLCIENMDNRKDGGRTVDELRALFEIYPDATFCLDVGHARQIDPTMAMALLMLMEFAPRLRQLHVSDVGARGEHRPVGLLASWAYERVAQRIPASCPLIIESVIKPEAMARELDAVTSAFDPERSERRAS